jgi:hypothetical protein
MQTRLTLLPSREAQEVDAAVRAEGRAACDALNSLRSTFALPLRDGFTLQVTCDGTLRAVVTHAAWAGEPSTIIISCDRRYPDSRRHDKGRPPLTNVLRMAAFYNKFDAHALPQSRGILAEALCTLLAWMAEQPALAAARLMLEASGSVRGAREGDNDHDVEVANELELVRYYARRFGFVPAYPDDLAADADDLNVPMIATVADVVSHCRTGGAREAMRPRLEGGTRRARRSARRARAQTRRQGRGRGGEMRTQG